MKTSSSVPALLVFAALLAALAFPARAVVGQVADTNCVAIPDARKFINLENNTRPIQREVFQGVPTPGGRNAPPEGTVVRIYSTPLEITGDFDGDGTSETVRALTEVAGPGGADPCPNGPESDGCFQGERIVEEPFWSSTGEWTLPAELISALSASVVARSEERIENHVPRTFEIRFTSDDAGSFAFHAFSERGVQYLLARYPIEVWDIGEAPIGTENDPSDDVRMALIAFSDQEGQCNFGYDEYEMSQDVWVSDRLYAYYFYEGDTYDEFDSWVRNALPIVAELQEPLDGVVRSCDAGNIGPFSCSQVDLLAYIPRKELGVPDGTVIDHWGWTDSATGIEYALVTTTTGTSFVDLGDPTNPVIIGHLPAAGGPAVHRDVKVFADHAFIVGDEGSSGLQVFDLTELRSVQAPPVSFQNTAVLEFGFPGEPGNAHNIVVNEATGFAYVVGSRDASVPVEPGGDCPGLFVLDVRAPANPVFSGCLNVEGTGFTRRGYTHDAQCVIYEGPDAQYTGREICFMSNETHIVVADVTDKTAMSALSIRSHPSAGYVHQGWLTEDHRYFLQDDELDGIEGTGYRTFIWDVQDLDDPQILTIYEGTTDATDHNLYVKGNLVYQANYTSGLRVLDISDIETPREVAFFDTYPFDDRGGFDGAWTNYPFFESKIITVSSINEGLFVLRLATGVRTEDIAQVPQRFHLEQNYPNPFNPTTTISYDLPEASDVTLTVVDLLGRVVRELAPGTRPAGSYEISFDATDIPSGIYFYRLQAGDYVETRRMVVVR